MIGDTTKFVSISSQGFAWSITTDVRLPEMNETLSKNLTYSKDQGVN